MMDIDKQMKVFLRGAADLLPSEEALIQKLKENRPLRIKLGVDPTTSDLHLGHTVPIEKLRQLQDIGHEIYFLVGTFTAQIGDPSGRDNTRPQLSPEAVLEYARTYEEQVFRLLDKEKTKVVYNGDWLAGMNLADMMRLAAQVTVARMLERDSFEKRWKAEEPIRLHEFLYCLLQGYDSVVLKADVELGGTDQTFNMLMGRTIQQAYGQPQQCVLTLPILPGTDGVQKMSKSLGNYIGITEEPDRMYGKAMSLPDEVMLLYFKLLTGVSLEELDELEASLADYAASPSSDHTFHPRLVKRRLATELVKRFWDEAAAEKAAENFELLHPSAGKQAEAPDDLVELQIAAGKLSPLDLVEKAGFPGITSRSDIKRLIKQGAVSLDGKKLLDASAPLEVADGAVLKVGKGNFARIKVV